LQHYDLYKNTFRYYCPTAPCRTNASLRQRFLPHKKENRICIKLNEADQYAFCAFDKTIIYPVPNKWGKRGWTLINLAKVEEETLKDATVTAFFTVAPEKIAREVRIINI